MKFREWETKLLDLIEILGKLPNKCKEHDLKQFIFNVGLHLQYYERFGKCIDCDGDNE